MRSTPRPVVTITRTCSLSLERAALVKINRFAGEILRGRDPGADS
jgi:hypothetical protein